MPLVNALVLADRVYRDGDTAKCVVAGTFNQINVRQFPVTHHGAAIYVNLSDFRGKHSLSLRFVNLSDNGRKLGESSEAEIELANPLDHFELAINMPPLILEQPGLYAIELLWDGKYLGACKVSVQEESK